LSAAVDPEQVSQIPPRPVPHVLLVPSTKGELAQLEKVLDDAVPAADSDLLPEQATGAPADQSEDRQGEVVHSAEAVGNGEEEDQGHGQGGPLRLEHEERLPQQGQPVQAGARGH